MAKLLGTKFCAMETKAKSRERSSKIRSYSTLFNLETYYLISRKCRQRVVFLLRIKRDVYQPLIQMREILRSKTVDLQPEDDYKHRGDKKNHINEKNEDPHLHQDLLEEVEHKKLRAAKKQVDDYMKPAMNKKSPIHTGSIVRTRSRRNRVKHNDRWKWSLDSIKVMADVEERRRVRKQRRI